VSRNYRREYSNETIARRKKRVNRNLARRIMKRKGLVKKGDKKDVHHVGGDASNKKSKLKAVPRSKNRSYARTKTARKKNKKS
jgi:hypothetical protein